MGRTWVRAVVVVIPMLVAGVTGRSELVHHRSRRRRLGAHPGTAGTETAVVVLGFRDRGPRANRVNRARVRAGLRSRPRSGPSTLVLSGGSAAGRTSEAALMAEYARSLGAREPIVLEESSRTTWENVRCTIPLVERFDRIMLVSGALHAGKARGHLWQQRPDLADRLVEAQDHRFGELLPLRPVMAALGLRNLARIRSGGAPGGTTR